MQIVSADKDEEFRKTCLRYSKYIWCTWVVWKIFIKLTTYYVMKAMDMNTEAHSWITDWGPLVNTFIHILQWPGSKLILFLYGEPYLFFPQDSSVRSMVFFFDSLICMNYWTIVFIIMFMYAIWDIASFYGHRRMKALVRQIIKEIELEASEEDYDEQNKGKCEVKRQG